VVVLIVILWAAEFKNKAFRVWCDNVAVVAVLNLGRGCDPIMQSIVRNVWLLTSVFDIELEFQHIQG
jgi:hypothetical protein